MILAINGGHTHSTAISYGDNQFDVVHGKSLNHHLFHSFDTVAPRISELLQDLAARRNMNLNQMADVTERFVISIPGAASEADQAIVHATIVKAGWPFDQTAKLDVIDDTWAGLIAGTHSFRGICATAGTGASVYVGKGDHSDPFGANKDSKIDGWGCIIGDFGSGFQLAVEMFRRLNRRLDWGEGATVFEEEILKTDPELTKVVDVQEWFDLTRRAAGKNLSWILRFAKFGETVCKLADHPFDNKEAQVLIDRAADDFIESILIAHNVAKDATLPIVLQGGMVEHCERYRNRVISNLLEKHGILASLSAHRPVFGALLYASVPKGSPLDSEKSLQLHNLLRADKEGAKLVHPAGVLPPVLD